MKLLTAWALALFSVGFAMAQKDQPPTFKSGTDLVTSAVLVRDAQGRAVGSLRAEDFAIFDKGKPQAITVFSVEHLTTSKAITTRKTAATATPTAAPAPAEEDHAVAERYLAYVFDDRQLNPETLMRLREAARKHMAELRPGDHAAIFTTSNAVTLNFTTSTDELQHTLLKLTPGEQESRNCPDLSFFEADQIINKKDYDAIMAALYEIQVCAGMTSRNLSANAPPDILSGSGDPAVGIIKGVATSVFQRGEQRTRNNFEMLDKIVGLHSGAPGQRVLALASPGFLTPQEGLEKNALMDRALRSQIVINSLDARGLYTSGLAITKHNSYAPGSLSTFPYASVKGDLAKRAAGAETNVLAELAYGTGGTLFENKNDLAEGFRQVAGAPEYLYMIGFRPEKLKLDGNFHALKVELKNQPGLKVESARKGYYAEKPK